MQTTTIVCQSSSEQRKSFLWPAEGLWSTHHKLSTDTIHGWWTRYYQEVHRWRWISSRLLFQRRNTVIRVKPSTSCSQTMESPLITRHSCRPYITNIYIKNMHWFRLASSNQRLVMKSTRRWRVWPGTVNKSRAWPIMATWIQVRRSPLFIQMIPRSASNLPPTLFYHLVLHLILWTVQLPPPGSLPTWTASEAVCSLLDLLPYLLIIGWKRKRTISCAMFYSGSSFTKTYHSIRPWADLILRRTNVFLI